ncbi:MAG: AraC family transcriptional regulator [Prevotellaceae bacterium]|jgi:AraC-like DNA-binding protein|nr:AraC family transcriptional regulator [Prevotellaceae bacterium]
MAQSVIVNEITPLSERDCFYIADRHKTEFTYPLHTHTECELNFVERGSGVRRIVGDSVEVIGDYDLVLITSSQLEHVWEQNGCKSKDIREITIQFSAEQMLGGLLNKTQFNSINHMLTKARYGIVFPQSAIMKVYSQLDTLAAETEGFSSFIRFLTILYELSQYDARILSSSAFAQVALQTDSRRIQKVLEYIDAHYQEELRMTDLAFVAGMSSAAFSRFFKMHTGKNVSEHLTDQRLGYAARLLVDTNMPICQICYQCGFSNISNFNRIFKRKRKIQPSVFRENYRKKKKLV